MGHWRYLETTYECLSSSILRKTISEAQMGIKPVTFCWRVRCSNHWAAKMVVGSIPVGIVFLRIELDKCSSIISMHYYWHYYYYYPITNYNDYNYYYCHYYYLNFSIIITVRLLSNHRHKLQYSATFPREVITDCCCIATMFVYVGPLMFAFSLLLPFSPNFFPQTSALCFLYSSDSSSDCCFVRWQFFSNKRKMMEARMFPLSFLRQAVWRSLKQNLLLFHVSTKYMVTVDLFKHHNETKIFQWLCFTIPTKATKILIKEPR